MGWTPFTDTGEVGVVVPLLTKKEAGSFPVCSTIQQGIITLTLHDKSVISVDGAQLAINSLHEISDSGIMSEVTYFLSDNYTYLSYCNERPQHVKLRLVNTPSFTLLSLSQAMSRGTSWLSHNHYTSMASNIAVLETSAGDELVTIQGPHVVPGLTYTELSESSEPPEPSIARFVLYTGLPKHSRYHSSTIQRFLKICPKGCVVSFRRRRKRITSESKTGIQDVWVEGFGVVVRVSSKSGKVSVFFPEPSFFPSITDLKSLDSSEILISGRSKSRTQTKMSSVFDLQDAGQVESFGLNEFMELSEKYTAGRSPRYNGLASGLNYNFVPDEGPTFPIRNINDVTVCEVYSPLIRIQDPRTFKVFWIHETNYQRLKCM